MRLGSYIHAGRPGFGAAVGDTIVDLTGAFGAEVSGVVDLIQLPRETVEAAIAGARTVLSPAEVRFLPPIPVPPKIIAIGLNTKSHFEEGRARFNLKEHPQRPVFFMRPSNSLVGHGVPIIRPKVSETLDFEAEIALIIGKGGRYIDEADAEGHIFGVTCSNEGSVREYQLHSSTLTGGKVFPSSGAIGPWIVSCDEAPALADLSISLTLNGAEMQRMTMDDLIFSPAKIIAYLSECMELEPGDVIITGSPAGVGAMREPPVWLKPGDRLAITMPGIGTLENAIVDDPHR